MMQEITKHALKVMSKRAPVWAISMAGRTKVFTDEDVPTAYVTGGGGRFKIMVNPEIAKKPLDLEFTLLHEVAHIFREDLVSMQSHPHMAEKINVAADCIINDALISMGVGKPSFASKICWGKDVYKKDCSKLSINNLIKVEVSEQDKQKATAPGNVSAEGESLENGESENGQNREEGGVGAGEKPCPIIGIGSDPRIHRELKPLAHSVAMYARTMFFEKGFRSNNMVTRLDWRRNRSAFAAFTDVAIPRSETKLGGRERGGPLVNLVLDVSGSMNHTWVATAAKIAEEIERAGLDYDLWLTPMRRKARDKKTVIQQLLDTRRPEWDDLLEETSFPGEAHWGMGAPLQEPLEGAPTKGYFKTDAEPTEGADELQALARFETQDPVVWIYIGDYHSEMRLHLHYMPNFLHVMLVSKSGPQKSGGPNYNSAAIEKHNLPHWYYAP